MRPTSRPRAAPKDGGMAVRDAFNRVDARERVVFRMKFRTGPPESGGGPSRVLKSSA
jgi:hypothetical protein